MRVFAQVGRPSSVAFGDTFSPKGRRKRPPGLTRTAAAAVGEGEGDRQSEAEPGLIRQQAPLTPRLIH
jgi:hypothetical protein